MPYNCLDNINVDVTSNCSTQTIGGLEVDAYIFVRGNHSITYDGTLPNKITTITNSLGKKAYKLSGVKALLDGGHDLITAVDRPDAYTHYAAFQQFEFAAAKILGLDNANDLFFVFERKDKGTAGDGTFVAYGVKNGMNKSTDTRRYNTIQGARALEFVSPESGEPYSNYVVLSTDYATTKTMLEGLLVAGV